MKTVTLKKGTPNKVAAEKVLQVLVRHSGDYELGAAGPILTAVTAAMLDADATIESIADAIVDGAREFYGEDADA